MVPLVPVTINIVYLLIIAPWIYTYALLYPAVRTPALISPIYVGIHIPWIYEKKGVGVFITRTRSYTSDSIYLYFMKHLNENKMTYWQHWRLAMSCSIALFIHAWYPDVLEKYASDRLCDH